ncbi:MAG: class II glutamine amidotransferase [candidate division Zixibacteria bacterium]|nr:class II glutamine amidotransferase [candidate division Zixibacteria bacterium]
MCRLLCVSADQLFAVDDYFPAFSRMAQNSREYQGHGWGIAWRQGDQWRLHHSITPVWEDNLPSTIQTRLCILHARSAFENKDIALENNMPFQQGNMIFAFNGELRGVRIKAEGRIGAEKLFNVILSRYRGDLRQAVADSMKLLEQRTTHLKAANLIISDGASILLASRFTEKLDYYTMWRKADAHRLVICSEPLYSEALWSPVAQGVEKVA